MEFELKKMYENVQAIHDEMFFLRERWVYLSITLLMNILFKAMLLHLTTIFHEHKLDNFLARCREAEMQELNRSTNSKMAWMTGLSILICLSVAGLQLWHLKTFFEKKKLI